MHCFWGLAPIERKARKRVLKSADLKEKRDLQKIGALKLRFKEFIAIGYLRLLNVLRCVNNLSF